MKKISILLVSMSLAATQATPAVEPKIESSQNPLLVELYHQFGSLFKKYYPDVTSHLLKDEMQFEHDTRIFLVHEPFMTGGWQDPIEEHLQ